MKIYPGIFFLLLFPLYAFSQNSRLKFSHLQTDAGLSKSNVTCILQDSRGFMWFGTMDGLNKYDSYHFTAFKNNPDDPHSLANNNIKVIKEDSKGNIWISTGGGGLNMYDREKNIFISYRYNANDKN